MVDGFPNGGVSNPASEEVRFSMRFPADLCGQRKQTPQFNDAGLRLHLGDWRGIRHCAPLAECRRDRREAKLQTTPSTLMCAEFAKRICLCEERGRIPALLVPSRAVLPDGSIQLIVRFSTPATPRKVLAASAKALLRRTSMQTLGAWWCELPWASRLSPVQPMSAAA